MEVPGTARSTVQRWRDEIDRAVELASAEPLSVALAAPGCGHCYVVKALDVHPCLGKVRGRRLLASLGVAQSARIEDISEKDRAAIAANCGCGRG
ncbi:MAG: hypothetical protein ACO36A_06790 [Ilumatobacteraceae bacterium]